MLLLGWAAGLQLLFGPTSPHHHTESFVSTHRHLAWLTIVIGEAQHLQPLVCLCAACVSMSRSCVQIRSLAPLTSLSAQPAAVPPLRELYCAANKVAVMEGLAAFTGLTLLELGSNRIRNIEGLEVCGWVWVGRGAGALPAGAPAAAAAVGHCGV